MTFTVSAVLELLAESAALAIAVYLAWREERRKR